MGVYQITPDIKYYVEDPVAKQLNKKRTLVTKKDRDWFAIVDGEEGSGKSWLAIQLAKFLDPSFDVDMIAFNGKSFLSCIKKAKKGQAVVFDEAFTGLSARASMSEMNKLLIETIMEVRKKNLFVFIVLPSIFYLDRYVVLARARVCFHTYFKGERRGRFCIYDKRKIKWLILKGRKTMSYAVVRPSYRGKFTGYFALDKAGSKKKRKLYEQMKLDAVNSKGQNRLEEKSTRQRNVLIMALKEIGKTHAQISDIFAKQGIILSVNTIDDISSDFNKSLFIK